MSEAKLEQELERTNDRLKRLRENHSHPQKQQSHPGHQSLNKNQMKFNKDVDLWDENLEMEPQHSAGVDQGDTIGINNVQSPKLQMPAQFENPKEPSMLNSQSLSLKLQEILQQMDPQIQFNQLFQLLNIIRQFKQKSDTELGQINDSILEQNQLYKQLDSNNENDVIMQFITANKDNFNYTSHILSSQLQESQQITNEVLSYLTQQYDQLYIARKQKQDLAEEVERLKREIQRLTVKYEMLYKNNCDLDEIESKADNELNLLIKQQNDMEQANQKLESEISKMKQILEEITK